MNMPSIQTVFKKVFLENLKFFFNSRILRKIVKNKEFDFLFICPHIGDFVISLGFLAEFRRQKNIRHLKIYGIEKFRELFLLYMSDSDEYIALDSVKLQSLLDLAQRREGAALLKRLGNVHFINPHNAFTEHFFEYPVRFPNLTFVDCIKYGCLGLDEKSEFLVPEIFLRTGTDERKIILCEKASVTESVSREKFFFCEDFFKNRGVSVSFNDEKRSFVELLDSVGENTLVIGTRSGLLDLLALKKCTVVAVYPDGNIYRRFFSLANLPERRAKIFEVFESELDVEFLEKIA